MSDFKQHSISSNVLNVRKNQSFAIVAGLGGYSARPWSDEAENNQWWAAKAGQNVIFN